VFQAFTDRSKLERWWGHTRSARVDQLELRDGGAWRFTDFMPGGEEVTFYGFIHEISSPARIVQTAEFALAPERGHVVLDRYEFAELPGGKTQLTLTEAFLSVADRDEAFQSGMQVGVVAQHEHLDLLFREGDSV
jgi:uncharacterized protein YndB with AHSA1/START domain